MNALTDVAGVLVGHHHRLDPDATRGAGWASGVTVVLTPPGTIGAVDVRGGAPGTRETDLLDPSNSVRYVDAVVLAGGSAFGLAAADGVMRWLEEHDRGVAKMCIRDRYHLADHGFCRVGAARHDGCNVVDFDTTGHRILLLG